MKKHTKPYKLLFTLALLITATWSFADGGDGEKKKTYSKSYPVSATDKISVNNQFGEVKIVTWDKREVKAEVTITARFSSDERSQAVLDGISIEDGKNADGVWFKTKLDKGDGKGMNNNRDDKDKDGKKARNEGMEIDYVINMPASNPLSLVNLFGRAIVPDMTGPLDINVRYGLLTTGHLSNAKTVIVEYGAADIQSVSDCKLSIRYSSAKIQKLAGDIRGRFDFCRNVKLSLDNSVTGLSLDNSYSTIEVNVSNNFNGDFNITTRFGNFSNKTGLGIKEAKSEQDDHRRGPRFNKAYSGKTGSGACKVKMKSSFGDIKFI